MADPPKPGPGHPAPHHLTLTQADQDIIKSFLSSVPAGFPLSPGAALAELSSFSPLSPSLPSSNYHFSLSPARTQDPPSPRHVQPELQRYGQKPVQSPKRHHTPQRSSLAGFHSPKLPSSSHLSPQRPGLSRTHSPDLSRPRSPGDLLTHHRKDTFSSPAWSPPRQSDSPTYRGRAAAGHAAGYLSSPSHPSQLFDCDPVAELRRHAGPGDTGATAAHGEGVGVRRPRQSHSPATAHSPPPRQSIDYSPLLPVGSFSPRRSYFNPPNPNPYSPVNPPAPYSPRRVVTAADHRYLDPCPSPSQLTHPPSPSRELSLSPAPSPAYRDPPDTEPLDLDIHHTRQHSPKTLPVKTPKPLTLSVKKKLGISKSKGRSKLKNKRSPEARRGSPDKKAPPPSTHLETNLSEVRRRLEAGCGCDLRCFSGLDSEVVWRHRCNIAELSKGEHDMYLMGVMMASLANPRATSKHKERQRNRNKYIFQGKEICQEAFLYLENVTIYQLKSIRKHVLEKGVVARVHRNTGKRPHNVLELDHYQLCHRFVQDLLDKERGPGPGGGGGRRKTFLADLTCKKLHTSYLQYFSDLGMDTKTMAYSTFRHFVHQRFPQLKFTSRETVLAASPGDAGLSINVSATNRQDTILSIETETHHFDE